MSRAHVLVVPYPAQGHVIPLMEIAQCLANHDVKVTFLNTEFNHQRIVEALAEKLPELIHLASIPDGLGPSEDRNDVGKVLKTMSEVMPDKMEAFIKEINSLDCDKISCVVADVTAAWTAEAARRLGIRSVGIWPAAAAEYVLTLSAPKLIDDGIIDKDGKLLKDQEIQLSPDTPVRRTGDFYWLCFEDFATREKVFEVMLKNMNWIKSVDRLLFNSSYVLEPGAFSLAPNALPIGPLLASNRLGKAAGFFWPEESTCLSWLDKQPPNSVIFVAFGSFTKFNQTQFQELALGLELSNRPFLWVVRQDITTSEADKIYPTGFKERVGNRGNIVSWAPQQKVLSHPSIACFLSHCGWNSTIEGISNGVPFLCWPYFGDQFLNQSFICDYWKVGLGFEKDESGIIRHGEIKAKVEKVLTDGGVRDRALNLQAKVMESVKGGSSYKNFNNFIKWIKENGSISS